jgi:hypothetical protein
MRPVRTGLVLLAAVAIIFSLGVIAGRVSVPQQPAQAADASEEGEEPGGQAAAPQAPAEEPSGDGRGGDGQSAESAPAQDGTVAGAGPARIQDGVGVGYTRTPEGAVAAATNYVQALSGPLILADPETEEEQLQVLTESAPAIAQSLRLPTDGAAGTNLLLQTVPVRVRLDRYDADSATVSIWQTSLGGTTAGVPVLQRWGTTTVELRWVSDDWKQVSTRSAAGPVPLADDAQPTAASELIGTLEEYEEYPYAPAR